MYDDMVIFNVKNEKCYIWSKFADTVNELSKTPVPTLLNILYHMMSVAILLLCNVYKENDPSQLTQTQSAVKTKENMQQLRYNLYQISRTSTCGMT